MPDLDRGYVTILRDLRSWRWYRDSKMVHVWIELLLRAAWQEHNFSNITLSRGQCVIAYRTLAKDLGLSVRSIRTCMTRLKSTREVTLEATRDFTIVTICNYNKYQKQTEAADTPCDTRGDQQATHKRHIRNIITLNNNIMPKIPDGNFEPGAQFQNPVSNNGHKPRLPKPPPVFTISPEERFQAIHEFGPEWITFYEARFNEYAKEQPAKCRKYKSHIQTVRNWHRLKCEKGLSWSTVGPEGPGYYAPYVLKTFIQENPL